MAVGLAMVADPLVRTLFGDKWAEAIPVTAALALYTLIRSLYFAAGDVFKAQGRPEIVTRMHIFNLVILVPALYWAVVYYRSLAAVGWVQVGVVLVVGFVRTVVACRLLDLRLSQFARVLMPTLLSTAIMAALIQITMILTLGAAPVVRLALGMGVGAISYSLAILWLQRDVVLQARKAMRSVFSRA
jgi:PST family polysaccharide transporter